eukprot:sb/3467200/
MSPKTRSVKLPRGKDGYGIVIREVFAEDASKAKQEFPSNAMVIMVTEAASEDTTKSGITCRDFILEIDDKDVRKKSLDEIVKMIRDKESSSVLSLKLVARKPPSGAPPSKKQGANEDQPEKSEKGGRRVRIKVLPKSHSDDLDPDEVFRQISVANKGDNGPSSRGLSGGGAQPVRILPVNCDAATIWEQARKMQEKRRGSSDGGSNSTSGEFLPEQKPTNQDPGVSLKMCRDHPYKWDKHQLGEWLKSVSLTHVATVFDSNHINGENLRTMCSDTLGELGLTEQIDQIMRELVTLLERYGSAATL